MSDQLGFIGTPQRTISDDEDLVLVNAKVPQVKIVNRNYQLLLRKTHYQQANKPGGGPSYYLDKVD